MNQGDQTFSNLAERKDWNIDMTFGLFIIVFEVVMTIMARLMMTSRMYKSYSRNKWWKEFFIYIGIANIVLMLGVILNLFLMIL